MGRRAKATGNVPQLSSRSSEPIPELQDLLDLLGRTGISTVLLQQDVLRELLGRDG